MKYYAVLINDEKKIFTDWLECKDFIKGKKGVQFKSFSTLEEAHCFLDQKEQTINSTGPCAYIDGSYDRATEAYSFGGVLIIDQQQFQFKKKYEKDEFSSSRNVAGEIKGAGYLIQYAINHGIKELDIYYDYAGIEKWFTGEWKANSLIARKYVSFKEQIKNQIIIHFHKVKSHTNNQYNDLADQLAKEALGLK